MEFLDPDLLQLKTEQWADELNLNNDECLSFASPALVVVDMQKDFLLPEGLLKVWGGPAIIPRVARLIAAFHAARRPVYFTRHIYEDPEKDGGLTARWWKVDRNSWLLRKGTRHAELHHELKPGRHDRVLAKRRYSAFFGTDLELLLRTSGVRDIVVAGVCTNICCEATAHDAFFRDFNVFFLLDGTGATDEDAHVATLRNISLCYGQVITVRQAVESLNRSIPDSANDLNCSGDDFTQELASQLEATVNQ